jgi:5-(carboxyamino)imidazole ribonucleotide mutase
MIASKTNLPVVGVPVPTSSLNGIDSLYSILQMPRGYPVATMAIGAQGAKNGGLLAAQIIALSDPKLNESLSKWRIALSSSIPNEPKDE